MRGRGELLATVSREAQLGLAGRELVLFKPSFSIGTAWAFRALAVSSGAYDSRAWAEGRLAAWASGDLGLESLLHNSFEAVVFRKYVAYGALFERLATRGFSCLMSGSGSCCFALVSSAEEASELESLVFEAWGNRAFLQRTKILG